MTVIRKISRCAVYTRKSSEHNLDLEFNSLDAQREACEAYIKSQTHEGWQLIPDHYDDGGISGASLDRPDVQRLLAAIQIGKIDIVVVYKVDRLTRSLADFAKLVELFDQHQVSFVSVTQSFNTTSSMGRLTLNVLLSFAQFEREVIGERVRDKISASKRKGIWVGGPIPLGYASLNKKIVMIPEEADIIRNIFHRYLEIGSVLGLLQYLDLHGVRTKRQELSTGRTRGGGRFGKSGLNYLLKNRFYIGEFEYRGEIHSANHDAIVERGVFDAVQAKLAQNNIARRLQMRSSPALLMGKIFDDRNNRMTPSQTLKQGVRYRYYVSQASLTGRKAEAGNVPRVCAPDIEALVFKELRARFDASNIAKLTDREVIDAYVERIIVKPTVIEIQLINDAKKEKSGQRGDNEIREENSEALLVSWQASVVALVKGAMHIPPDGSTLNPKSRDALLKAVAKARNWIDDIIHDRTRSFAEIAKREGAVERHVRILAPLAFASPRLVQAIVDGSAPAGLTVTGLAQNLSWNWKSHLKMPADN